MPRLPKVKVDCPHGCFASAVTQTITGLVTAAYPIALEVELEKHRLTHSTVTNNSRIYVQESGSYLITYSAICRSAAPNKTIDIWLSMDGSNVANSNTRSKFVGSANERVITVTYIEDMVAGSYCELYWASDDTGTIIEATAAQTDPTRPACPSIIVTVNKVSEVN